MVFTKIFPFGTNSIINDISKLCSINENEVRLIIKKIDFAGKIDRKKLYRQKSISRVQNLKNYQLSMLKKL